MGSKRRSNKSLELSPGVGIGSDAIIPNSGGDWAQVGGAAQLYVMTPQDSLVEANEQGLLGEEGQASMLDPLPLRQKSYGQ